MTLSPLAALESRLRPLLPADLYARAWLDPAGTMLLPVFEHLRTLQRILHDYMPRNVSASPPVPGTVRHAWQAGTLMFTDLAGFTRLMEANAAQGRAGAETLLHLLNAYFAEMIAIISMSGGDLLEFTGDALLAQFRDDPRHTDTARAVRAGLRMQRAMERFAEIATPLGTYSLRMRVGLHAGRFITADVGTPRRMEHVLLGSTVHHAKLAEGAGQAGRVSLTESTCARVSDRFRFEPCAPGYVLVVDDLSAEELGEYDLVPPARRTASSVLWDRSAAGVLAEIEKAVKSIEPLAAYLPVPILNLLVESAARRQITPDFPTPTVLIVTLIGLAECADQARPEEEGAIVAEFSRAVALINAAVETRGGVLKKVTYHPAGSDMVMYFGVPNAHTDDPVRAADAALAVRDVVAGMPALQVGSCPVKLSCQAGLARGPAFAAEVGEPHGRREFNVSGDVVNTAARLMGRAGPNQVLLSEAVYHEIAARFETESLGAVALKGKSAPVPIYALCGRKD